jgi:hypothetical protein
MADGDSVVFFSSILLQYMGDGDYYILGLPRSDSLTETHLV